MQRNSVLNFFGVMHDEVWEFVFVFFSFYRCPPYVSALTHVRLDKLNKVTEKGVLFVYTPSDFLLVIV
jgi:hypothetical protein